MAHPKISYNTTLTKSSQTWDQIPRRRKRHVNKMSLMLLIFVGCCSTLILWPLDVQAKDLNTATTKGENNMLGNDRHSHQQPGKALPEGEGNVSADKTNDNGTFKRLQPSDDDEEEHSSEVIEMIQPPHTLRHQEHYKQRILQAGNDFQHKQHKHEREHGNEHKHQPQQPAEDSDGDDGDDDDEEEELSQHNRHLRYQQIQLALREPLTTPPPPPPAQPQQHHRRHEHHFAKQTEFKWPQHHLRHQHHQNVEPIHNLPQLRHQRHEVKKQQQQQQNSTFTTTAKPMIHQRYFDRESLYLNPLARIATTEGPHLRHKGSNKHFKSITGNPHNRLFNDDDSTFNSNNNGHDDDEDIKRISLSLDANENKDNPTNENLSLGDSNENYDGDVNVDDDDYSYDDEDDDDKNELYKQNKYPSIASNPKTNVKRYTNPLRSLYKTSSFNQRSIGGGHHLRHSSYHVDDMNTNGNDDDYDLDKSSSSSSGESSNDNDNGGDEDKFSDEKWNKIEHEHYSKQLQHQRAMQALRSRRPVIDNSGNINKQSSSSSYNSASTNRQIINNDDTDNVYSRYYVPGSITRKKEEELGSPTAIVESRRQYALQQRQNKALASAHHRRIVTEGSCRLPQPRVEPIRRDSWKIYTPHCTILYRCADDTGCCPSERQTCAPKRTKNVDLYFFVNSLNETQGSIEKLTFVNHTECHCVDKSKQRAPEYAAAGSKELLTNQITYLRRATILNCNCPNLFEKILQEDGYCRCDCSSGNLGCDWLKRGMEHFSMNDRKCIIEGRCKLPTCEYGQYIKKHGRCPRREERQLSADVDW